MCFTTAKQGQLQPSSKNNSTRTNNIIHTNRVKDREIKLKKSKRKHGQLYNMKPAERGQKKVKKV
jgi:hypothetical protein